MCILFVIRILSISRGEFWFLWSWSLFFLWDWGRENKKERGGTF